MSGDRANFESNRHVRVFISSTFRDMIAEREELMSRTWPQLRQFCLARQIELVEVDLRWGIAEAQSTRRETLKLCLDEIRSCRPFFIGLLGERYGWIPGEDAFTKDLQEEQGWIKDLRGRSVTELEILHGVLNDPGMAGRSFFYFRDPAYANARGADFQSESQSDASRQAALKELIRRTCAANRIALHESYGDPEALGAMVLEHMKAAIDAQYPAREEPDPLTREELAHEAIARRHRQTYVAHPDSLAALDRHAGASGGPLVLLGESGSGKSALLANWTNQWRNSHPGDFLFQHFIGSTPDSCQHLRLMSRLMARIKQWTDDPEDLPRDEQAVVREFPLWLAKARARAQRERVRFIVVLDALNQLDEADHALLLAWLPQHAFTGPLRLIASTLPGGKGQDDPLVAALKRGWATYAVPPLVPDERRRLITGYLKRFGKQLDAPRLDRLANAPASANPLYLRILLDELRVTGTHDDLDVRIDLYLREADVPGLLARVLDRWQRDYDRDRPGLVRDTLGLIWAARRGLSESELLILLRHANFPQLPQAIWAPLRAAMEESVVDRDGILNFAHEFLRSAVQSAFAPDASSQSGLRLTLANFFDTQPISARSCDELPWLLRSIGDRDRLRACLLDVDRFLLMHQKDEAHLKSCWLWLKQQRTMELDYVTALERWSTAASSTPDRISCAANEVAYFLTDLSLHAGAEKLIRRALAIDESILGTAHPRVSLRLNNLARILHATNRLSEAEGLMRRAIAIDETDRAATLPFLAKNINNLATLLLETNRLREAEELMRRALVIDEAVKGAQHPFVARDLGNLASILMGLQRHSEAERLFRRAMQIEESALGETHPDLARTICGLAALLLATGRLVESEALARRALVIVENALDPAHPRVSAALNVLAQICHATGRLSEAETLTRRALAIDEAGLGNMHTEVANRLNNLAQILQATGRLSESEPMLKRALEIYERALGPNHPSVAMVLNNLGHVVHALGRSSQAEPLLRRHLEVLLQASKDNNADHQHLIAGANNYGGILMAIGVDRQRALLQIQELFARFGRTFE